MEEYLATKIQIKVTPNASQNRIEGWKDGVLRIRLKALPEKGKANEALIAFLSETFRVPKSHIQITSGHTSRLKRVMIEGVDEECLRKMCN